MTLLRSWFDFQPLSRTSIDSAPVPFGTAIIPSSSASGGYLLLTTQRNSSVTSEQRNVVGSHLFGRFNLTNMIYIDLQHLFCSCKSSRVCPQINNMSSRLQGVLTSSSSCPPSMSWSQPPGARSSHDIKGQVGNHS